MVFAETHVQFEDKRGELDFSLEHNTAEPIYRPRIKSKDAAVSTKFFIDSVEDILTNDLEFTCANTLLTCTLDEPISCYIHIQENSDHGCLLADYVNEPDYSFKNSYASNGSYSINNNQIKRDQRLFVQYSIEKLLYFLDCHVGFMDTKVEDRSVHRTWKFTKEFQFILKL